VEALGKFANQVAQEKGPISRCELMKMYTPCREYINSTYGACTMEYDHSSLVEKNYRGPLNND
jgi:hypothetical protein